MYVLMVVPSNFPNGDAGAVRDMAFAYIYQKLGYEVELIGAGRESAEGDYNGVHFYSMYKKATSPAEHFVKFINSSSRYKELVDQIIRKKDKPSIIHINSIPEKTISYLISLAENNATILHDSTEWYSPCEFTHGKLDKAYILKDRLNRRVIRNPIRVIGISSYLTEYFKSRGLKAVRIPVIMDVENTGISKNTGDKIRLIYAGSPANKDYLKEIVLGITMLSEKQKEKLELHILGANEDQIKSLTSLQALPTCIKAYGRVPREKVEETMLQMDFSVLLRPSEERYTKAGFPTKSVEAMAHGVAMICNLSSDLGMYLKDGKNAIIVDGYNEKAFAHSLERVLDMSRVEIDAIKHNARQLAEQEFDYRKWVKTISDFIGD